MSINLQNVSPLLYLAFCIIRNSVRNLNNFINLFKDSRCVKYYYMFKYTNILQLAK